MAWWMLALMGMTAGAVEPMEATAPTLPDPLAEQAYLTGVWAYLYGLPYLQGLQERYDLTHRTHADDPVYAPLNHLFYLDGPDVEGLLSDHPDADGLAALGHVSVWDGPVVLEVPSIRGRFAMIQITDLTGAQVARFGGADGTIPAGRYALVSEDYEGELPAGLQPLRLRGTDARVRVHIRATSVADASNARRLLHRITLAPLPEWTAGRVGLNLSLSAQEVTQPWTSHDAVQELHLVAERMLRNPPAPEEDFLVSQMSAIGLTPGLFRSKDLGPERLGALARARRTASQLVAVGQNKAVKEQSGWQGVVGSAPGHDLAMRAALADAQAWQPDDLLVFTRGEDDEDRPLTGERSLQVVLHRDALGEMGASLTVVPEEGDARALATWSDGVSFDDEGALTVLLQPDEPDTLPEHTAWLAVPEGTYDLVLRAYVPAFGDDGALPPLPGVVSAGAPGVERDPEQTSPSPESP